MSSNPFISSSHGHPSFNPVKVGSKGSALDSRLSKSPKPPDKFMMSFSRYNRKGVFQSPQKQNEGKMSLQGAEEENDDELSIKHAAAARFARNHRLINEIFSDTVVPDVRSVVTTARLKVLKNQVHSLQTHQKKLEAELLQIEEKFIAKKRKFIEASEAFQEEMRKRCSVKPVDQASFQKMIDKALEQLKKDQAAKEEMAKKKKEAEEQQQVESQVQPDKLDQEMAEVPKEEESQTTLKVVNSSSPEISSQKPSPLWTKNLCRIDYLLSRANLHDCMLYY